MQEFLSEIIGLKYHTMEVVELTVSLIAPEHLEFVSGQAMQLKIDGKTYDLLIASVPLENNKDLNFFIRAAKDSPVTGYIKKLVVGQKITLMGPTGEFKFEDKGEDLLCIAESTGIGLFGSLIPPAVMNNPDRKVKLLFEVHSEEQMFYFARFSKLAGNHPNFIFTPIVVRPLSHWPGEVGTAATFVKVSGKSFAESAVYISGHKNFVDTIMDEWHKIQFDKKNLYKYVIPEAL